MRSLTIVRHAKSSWKDRGLSDRERPLNKRGERDAPIMAKRVAETGIRPELSTSGGTSDARFIKHHCPVVEFGLVGKTMHQVDERVEVAQIGQLTTIYERILSDYFA